MEPVPLLDRAGRRRSPATLSSFHEGPAPRNEGLRYPRGDAAACDPAPARALCG